MSRKIAHLRASEIRSASVTPVSSQANSAYNSGYNTEDENVVAAATKPFRFLDLPSELRNKIYGLLFQGTPQTLDLDSDNYRLIFRKFSIFLVNRQIYAESCHFFYTNHVVRLFPCTPGIDWTATHARDEADLY